MKIAVITQYFPSSAEPWQGRSAYQTLRIIARQATVKVFYPNASYPSLLKPHSRIYDALDPAYSPPDVKTSYHSYPALPLISRPFNGGAAARSLLPHVRTFTPDLIFSVFLYPAGYSALKIGKALSIPVIAMGIGSDINRIGGALSAKYTRQVLRESDFTVTVSDDLRRKAIALGASMEKTRAILNGCDTSIFRPQDRLAARQKLNIDADAEAVVYIGRMDLKKGLLELVEAAAALHVNHPRLQVYMIGEGPDRVAVDAAISGHNAADYVHSLPACSSDDVAGWMTAADVVTLPSYMEGCPNVVLEALACGRPVVATRVGGIPEIMSDECGRLVAPRDPAALAAGIDAVLHHMWDASSLALHWSRSWNTVAAELFEVFQFVVTSHPAAAHGR